MVLGNQSDIFCIFHDGSFESFIRNQGDIDFRVDIPYLAEIINPSFSQFKGKLKNCTKLEYHVWGKENMIIDDFNVLETMELEIYCAEDSNDCIRVKCFSNDENCGGDLVIIADDIIVFDENDQEITLDYLDEICKFYWNSKRNQ